MLRWLLRAAAILGVGLVGGAAPLVGQAPGWTVPTPESHFGFRPGADRQLANWQELSAYYEKVAAASPRIALDTLGFTTRGRSMVMFTITSPENHGRLGELREIQHKLSDPRRISSEAELQRLKEDARTIVLVTSHIHSTEVGAGQMPANLVYRLATADDPDIVDILDRVVLLLIPSLNPDGTERVSNWYRRYRGTPFEGVWPVELYHEYVGHDTNRDWYAFTQVETQLTVEGAHNRWRPMIVHDIHQMGALGARMFVPPYLDPFEPNIDPLLVAAVNQLGSYMAAELTTQGKTGVVTSAQFDMYSPSRAYSHYHGGVRILSETASALLATRIQLRQEDLSGERGFRADQPSVNHPAPWRGGEWGLPEIVEYQESGVLALLRNAARNRRFWVDNFYEVQRRAVAGWESRPDYWVIPAGQANEQGLAALLRILTLGMVEVHQATDGFAVDGHAFPPGSYVIPTRQPYASFAQALLEIQEYPDPRATPRGGPARPYDVTAHTLPLLMGVEAVPIRVAEDAGPPATELTGPIEQPEVRYATPPALTGRAAPRIGLYRGWRETMPAGWTRWLLDQHQVAFASVSDSDLRAGRLNPRFDVIVFQDQAASQISEGWRPGQVPPEFTGGVGREGVAAIREFVRNGGRVVAIEAATDFAIDTFGLPVRNGTLRFSSDSLYIPGAILRLEVDPRHAMGARSPRPEIAWYGSSSRAFDVLDRRVRVIARYGREQPRLSGWALGAERIAGQPAIVEATYGRGSVLLFGFQPNYRGQSIATWPLLFDAIAGRR
jgi:hypothetical protein